MALECLIKTGIVYGLGITHWKDDLHPKNPKNPKHVLLNALRELPAPVQNALLADPRVAVDLAVIQSPPNSNYQYASLRYCGRNPADADHQLWLDAYKRLLRAVHKAFHRHLKGWQ
ncbi:hypothetical protein [Corallococcus sp. M7]